MWGKTFAAVVALLAAACVRDPVGPPDTALGTYDLVTVDGYPLPHGGVEDGTLVLAPYFYEYREDGIVQWSGSGTWKRRDPETLDLEGGTPGPGTSHAIPSVDGWSGTTSRDWFAYPDRRGLWLEGMNGLLRYYRRRPLVFYGPPPNIFPDPLV